MQPVDNDLMLSFTNSKSPEMSLIRELLAKTNLEFRDLNLAYDANKDGWRADIFH